MSQSFGSTVRNRRHLWRASWAVQDVEPSLVIAGLSDEGFCLNCGLDSHSAGDCPAPLRTEFQNTKCNLSNKNAVISLRCDTGQVSRHILPYEQSLKATVLHINHKENTVYVRPDIFQEKAAALDFHLRRIFETLEPLGTRNVKIGQVYLAYSCEANTLARAVCGHMKYTHQSITRFQMYFIDDGRLEFIEQKDVYLLPFTLGAIPPVCVPLDLTNCNKSLAFSTCVDHFRALQFGSRVVFALKSQQTESEDENVCNTERNENFPLAFTSRIFVGESARFELTCPKSKTPVVESNDEGICGLWQNHSSSTTFPFFAQKQSLPCDLTVRVARRCDREGVYWMIDEEILASVENQLAPPSGFLRIDSASLASYPCIAYVKLGADVPDLRYCRALTRDFSADSTRCSVFLVDYGKCLTCDVFSLFTLEGQPQTISETPGAAFLSFVHNCDPNRNKPEQRAYLCEGVTYPITLLSVDSEGVFYSSVYLPSVESILNELKHKETVEKASSSSDSLPPSLSPGESVEEPLEAHFLGKRLWDEDEKPEDDEDLTDIRFTLSRLEEKVAKCYEDLNRKLELLQLKDCELIRQPDRQRLQPVAKKTKNFLSRLILSRPGAGNASAQNTHFVNRNTFYRQNLCSDAVSEELGCPHGSWNQELLVRNSSKLYEERGKRHSITKKSKGSGLVENVLKVDEDDSPKSEGSSSSTDSGIERNEAHSISKRVFRSSIVPSPSSKAVSLKYEALFGHKTVSSGKVYPVKRSDGDYQCSLWPLFFVHIFCDDDMKILEEHFNSIKTSVRLRASQIKTGTICIAYCSTYTAKFRAVITAVESEAVEIFYVDYGNYEKVKPSTLYSIEKQNYTIRTHPGMAVPCILSSFDVGNVTSVESCKIKDGFRSAVTSEDDVFYLRFVAQRADGIYVVEKSEV